MMRYNGWTDPWAAYIVLEKFQMVQFPEWQALPEVQKSRLYELPDTELRQWMIDKQNWNGQPGSTDPDVAPAISLMRNDYVYRAQRVSFSHWGIENERQGPFFQPNPRGRALIITGASKKVATEEWWRAFKNPRAYHHVINNEVHSNGAVTV